MPEPIPYGVYISGPMQHVPDFNYPLFNRVAEFIRTNQAPVPHKAAKGTSWTVYPINPAANFEGQTDLSREVYLELALRQVDEAQAIVMLPGWETSPGARLELWRAMHNNADLWLWTDGLPACQEPWTDFVLITMPEAFQMLEATKQPVSAMPVVVTRRGPVYLDNGESEWTQEQIAEFQSQLAQIQGTERIEDEASRLVRNGHRQATYGHPRGDFDTIAGIWTHLLSSHNGRPVEVDAEMVAIMMSGLKLARLSSSPGHRDSKVDVIGYMICLDRLDEPMPGITDINVERERRGMEPFGDGAA